MIAFPSSVRVWLAVGRTDMRRGMNSPLAGPARRLAAIRMLYVFRGARGDLVKILWHDGLGLSLYANHVASYCTSCRLM